MVNYDKGFALVFPRGKQFKQFFGYVAASCQAIIAIKEDNVILGHNSIKPGLPLWGIQVDLTGGVIWGSGNFAGKLGPICEAQTFKLLSRSLFQLVRFQFAVNVKNFQAGGRLISWPDSIRG